MDNEKKGNLLALSPILVFLVLVFGVGLIANDFGAMPVLLAFIIAGGYALALNPKDKKMSIGEKFDLFCIGGGEKTIILMVIIFLLAGAFYATTIDIGARDATVNFGLRFVPQRLLLPGLFVISCFISFAMGTSMGTVAAISPIGIGLASTTGVALPLTLGIVIGGAMFGDNLSFVSDTTIAATRTQGVRQKDKFKVNLIIVLPAIILTFIALMFVKVDTTSAVATDSFNFWLIIPYLLVIATALIGMNVVTVLGIGIASASIIGLAFGSFDILGMLKSIQKGMGWMEDLALIAIVIGGLVSLMKAYGGIDWLMANITKNVKGKKGGEASIAALVSVLDLATANNTISIVAAGPIAKELNEQFRIDPRRTAGLLDIFSSAFQGMVPYGGQLLAAAALAGISPLVIVPYCWYPMLILLFGIISIAVGLPKLKGEALDEFGNPVLKEV